MSQNNFKEELFNFNAGFNPFFLAEMNKIESGFHYNKITKDLLNKSFKFSRVGGKRLRPFMTFLGFNAIKEIDKANLNKVYYLGMVLELFHLYGLIHDDILDDAQTRRGEISIHNQYQDNFQGLQAAILAGDYLHTFVNRMFYQNFTSSSLQSLYMDMQNEVSAGQNDDSLGVGVEKLQELKQENILNMLSLKSGLYSIQKPFLMGSCLAGEDLNSVRFKQLATALEKLGLIFQITDDILGVFGNTTQTGKPEMGDIIERKRTLLVYKTYEFANSSEKQILVDLYEKSNKKKAKEVFEIMHKYEIKQHTINYCKTLEQKIILMLSTLDINNNIKTVLTNMTDYLIQRSG